MTSTHQGRLKMLFCTPTTALSGGVKVVLEIATRLADRGHLVELFSYAGPPRWHNLRVPILETHILEEIDPSAYDFIFATNAFLLPLLLPLARHRLVFYAQDYESFHYSLDGTFEGFMSESPAIRELYRLPVPIITQSLAVQRLIRQRTGRLAAFAPLGIRKEVFPARPQTPQAGAARILFVGNYLMPYKGMADGFEALSILGQDREVELVLATQEYRNQKIFDDLPFKKEVHFRPPEEAMAAIYSSAHVYCCTSWYEGFGLPALEAFSCGVPVVSTRTLGVQDYGIDDVNLLLADVRHPADVAHKIARILDDPELAARLVAGGRRTIQSNYSWDTGIDAFETALSALRAAGQSHVVVDQQRLDDLLRQLEEEGAYTPIATFRRHAELARAVDVACAAISVEGALEQVQQLRSLRDQLAPYVVNSRAQYHRAFRATFDLCQLIIGLEGRGDLVPLVRRILSARSNHAPHTSLSLTEIRYLDYEP